MFHKHMSSFMAILVENYFNALFLPYGVILYVYKSWNFYSFCIFSCILTLLIILIKPLTTKAYDRRASGDFGSSGCPVCVCVCVCVHLSICLSITKTLTLAITFKP